MAYKRNPYTGRPDYYETPAEAASIASSIVDGDITHSPDGNSVFDALAGKAGLASPIFTGLVTTPSLTVTSLTDGYIPYHVTHRAGLDDGPLKTDVDNAVTLKHQVNTGGDFLMMQVFS